MNIDFNNCRLQHYRSLQKLKKIINDLSCKNLMYETELEEFETIFEDINFSSACIMASFNPGDEEFKDLSEFLSEKIHLKLR